jgi:hypothetical protein
MNYQVSRNGQLYGPYTLEDLRRYVASGNILPTDMAKSEEMPEWAPVSRVLGDVGAPAPDYAAPAYATPPAYAAPTAYAAPSGAAYPDPPNLNWGLELLLGFLTCGLFVQVWNLVIASWAKRVQPTSQALMYYIIATVLIVMNYGTSWGTFLAMAHHQPHHRNLLGGLISLVCWVVRLIARFTLRDTIEQHFNGPEPLGLRLNPVLTFFFGGIYIQYKLNEANQLKQTIRYQNMPR